MIRTGGYISLVVFLSFWCMDAVKGQPQADKLFYAVLLIVAIIAATAIYIVRSFSDPDNN